MSKNTHFTSVTSLPIGLTRLSVLDTLHTHGELIDLQPQVIERHPCKAPAWASAEEFHCSWYSITDKVSYLPGVKGSITYHGCFNDLEDGLQTHVYAPMGLEMKNRWTIGGNEPGEPRVRTELGLGLPKDGLYLREDVEIKCNILLTSFVRSNMKKAHTRLVDRLIEKAHRMEADSYNTRLQSTAGSIRHSLSPVPSLRHGSINAGSTGPKSPKSPSWTQSQYQNMSQIDERTSAYQTFPPSTSQEYSNPPPSVYGNNSSFVNPTSSSANLMQRYQSQYSTPQQQQQYNYPPPPPPVPQQYQYQTPRPLASQQQGPSPPPIPLSQAPYNSAQTPGPYYHSRSQSHPNQAPTPYMVQQPNGRYFQYVPVEIDPGRGPITGPVFAAELPGNVPSFTLENPPKDRKSEIGGQVTPASSPLPSPGQNQNGGYNLSGGGMHIHSGASESNESASTVSSVPPTAPPKIPIMHPSRLHPRSAPATG